MTTRSYYFSDQTEMDSSIVACEEVDGRYAILLTDTIFHPKGGGQLADIGWINDSPVLAVQSHGEQIHHIVGQPLAPGAARLKVDAPSRALHSRLHSAGHPIGHVGIAHALTPNKAQHWPGDSRVVFECEKEPDFDLATLAAEVNALVGQNLPRTCQMENSSRVIGFGDLPGFPCGGTHVRNLAEIGEIRLLGMKFKKNLFSITYDLP